MRNISFLRNKKGGFSLTELMVVVAIMTIMTSIVLVSQREFGANITLSNLAYDIAVSVREAQSYGLSVKGVAAGGTTTFNAGYGVYFMSNHDTQYLLYGDIQNIHSSVPNKRYDGPFETTACSGDDSNECIKVYQIGRGNKILDLCGLLADGSRDCTPTYLDVAFYRAESEAFITGRDGTGGLTGDSYSGTAPVLYTGAEIDVVSPSGNTRTVQITNTGQISVN
jgi:prepilin-type N-terminal cleavage/methylation domain-containing protein